MKKKKIKLLVLWNGIGTYHLARIIVAQNMKVLEIVPVEVVGGEGSRNNIVTLRTTIPESIKMKTLFPQKNYYDLDTAAILHEVDKNLSQIDPDVVAINGWSNRAALASLRWCTKNDKQTILMSDSTERDEKRVFYKEWVKKKALSCCDSAFVAGKPQKDYIVKLGMAPEKVFTGYDAVDNDYFSTQSQIVRKTPSKYRDEYGLPEKFFLSTNRFIFKKNLFRMIEAYAQYRAGTDKPWKLVLLGDGELWGQVEKKIEELGLKDSVILPGFKKYNDLPAYYALASCYIQASTSEQWGLVVNEALASGLPVLVSDMCGCQEDLVEDGKNGFTFDPFDVNDIAEKMLLISNGSCDLDEMGLHSRKIISNWGCDNFAKNLIGAAGCAVKNPVKPSLVGRLIVKALIR